MAIVRKEIIFHGRVQGVGFRFRACNIARDLRLTGWCQNEYDGTVKAQVQGEEENVYRLIKELNNSSYIVIDDVDIKNLEVDYHDSGFDVKYW